MTCAQRMLHCAMHGFILGIMVPQLVSHMESVEPRWVIADTVFLTLNGVMILWHMTEIA